MSRNQKAPLFAFVLVALVCGLILVDSVRGDAIGRLPLVSPSLPAPWSQSESPQDPSASGEQSEADDAGQAAASPAGVDPADQDASTGRVYGVIGAQSTLPGLGSFAGAPGTEPDVVVTPDAPTPEADDPSGSEDRDDNGRSHRKRYKNPDETIEDFGSDDGRPEVEPAHPGQPADPGQGSGQGSPDGPAEPGGPAGPAEPDEPAEPRDPADLPDDPRDLPEVVLPGPDRDERQGKNK